MANIFSQQKQKEKILILVFVVIVVLIFLVTWKGSLGGKKIIPTLPFPEKPFIPQTPKVEINFKVLQHPVLKNLQILPAIELPSVKPGRENPFVPYQ